MILFNFESYPHVPKLNDTEFDDAINFNREFNLVPDIHVKLIMVSFTPLTLSHTNDLEIRNSPLLA